MTAENEAAGETQPQNDVQEKASPAKRKPRAAKAAATEKPKKLPVEATPVQKKKRSPEERTRLMALVAKQTKNGKVTLKAALQEAGISEQTYYNWKNQAAKSAPAAGNSVKTDDLADLVALETENKRLRKELGEKLRAENSELRKRLGLS